MHDDNDCNWLINSVKSSHFKLKKYMVKNAPRDVPPPNIMGSYSNHKTHLDNFVSYDQLKAASALKTSQRDLENPAIIKGQADPFSSASRIVTELAGDAEQLLDEERMFSSGGIGRRNFRKSNTPEKYRSLRRSTRINRNQQIDLFARGVLDRLVDAHEL